MLADTTRLVFISACLQLQEMWEMCYGHGSPLLLPKQLRWAQQPEVLFPVSWLDAAGVNLCCQWRFVLAHQKERCGSGVPEGGKLHRRHVVLVAADILHCSDCAWMGSDLCLHVDISLCRTSWNSIFAEISISFAFGWKDLYQHPDRFTCQTASKGLNDTVVEHACQPSVMEAHLASMAY